MADTTTVVEGKIKFREGKKWKPRWCVLKKPSPVADRLQVLLYKDLTEYARNETKPKSVFALDAFFGLDAGFTYDRELHVLAIICYKNTSLMAFELRENMIQFEIKIRQSMGEEHQFPVKIVKAPSSSRIPKEPVRMIIHDMRFCLIAQIPPKILLSWNIEDLRRFGATEGKFCFEGGTRCGKGSGIFALQSEQAEDIANIVNLASTGKMANCHRKFKNRRKLSLPTSQEVVSEVSYITLVVPVDSTQAEHHETGGTTSAASQPCSLSQSTTYFNNIVECTNPAKTVLRPRSGSEYVLIHRKSIPSPVSFSGSSSRSPFLNVFNFELPKPNEAVSRSHHRHSLHSSVLPSSGHIFVSEYSSLPNNPQQGSPSISSTTETIRSASSMHFHAWEHEPSHSHHGRLQARTATGSSSPASSPHQMSHQPAASACSIQQRSAPTFENEDSIFFPMDMSFTTSPPSSPFGQHAVGTPPQHTPIYVNQEFVDKHNIASSSSQTVNNIGHSSTPPIRACVHSLMSLFKDSSKHNPPNEPKARGSSFRKGRTRSRHSESDANKGDMHSLTLPSSKQHQSVISHIPRRCHSDSRRPEAETNQQLTLAPDIHLSTHSKVHQKEYDKFADSSIISRRRRKCIETLCSENAETAGISSSAEFFRKDPALQYLPLPKSSGYKNIDCINAATYAAASTPSPRSLSSGPDASHMGQTSQLENIMESQISPEEIPSSNRSSVFAETCSLSPAFVFSGIESVSLGGSVPLRNSNSPPPLLPRRNHLSTSPLSSGSLTSVLTSSDASDSPPSYFAPSPPGTPPPPVLPPRIPLLSPPPSVPVSTSLEPETTSDSSEEEQELNYIEIDMTGSRIEQVLPPPPLAYSRRSKRARQQKEKDYAKLRYVVIDHRATKALQEARQEHEQCRDSSLRHIQHKDINLGRLGTHLSRINSAPASSKRKQISLMQRERKLSSGSTESC